MKISSVTWLNLSDMDKKVLTFAQHKFCRKESNFIGVVIFYFFQKPANQPSTHFLKVGSDTLISLFY